MPPLDLRVQDMARAGYDGQEGWADNMPPLDLRVQDMARAGYDGQEGWEASPILNDLSSYSELQKLVED